MKVMVRIVLCIALGCMVQIIQAQTDAVVPTPQLSLQDQGIHIDYDILNSTEEELFTIRIEVTDAQGRLIQAQSLTGDIGENIPGGTRKQIIWDIEADSIFLDEEIFIEVIAQSETPPFTQPVAQEEAETTIPSEPETPVTEKPEEGADQQAVRQPVDENIREETGPPNETENILTESHTEPAPGSTGRQFNRAGIILQSVAFPGLGLTRVNAGKPHWIKGVLGYGCLAGSVYFNRKAASSYDSYQQPTSLEQVENDFTSAERQDLVSEVLAYSAIGIWVTELIWTIVGTSDLNQTGFSIGTAVEPVSATPLIALRYRFGSK